MFVKVNHEHRQVHLALHPAPALAVAALVVYWLACCPLVPKFAGSNPAEAVGFFGRKNPQHAFLRRGSKAACRRFAACKICLHLPWKSHAVGKIGSAISLPYFPPSLIEVCHIAGRGAPLEMTGETKSCAQRARS
jgi:hypothetical protein